MNEKKSMRVPMLDLTREYAFTKNSIDAAVKHCFEHQQWIFGPEVEALENEMVDYIGVKHCVGVSSGTDALVLALRALALQRTNREFFDKDDEIITTPFTFTATGDAILRAGATPVFIDIDLQTYNIDTSKIREYLSSRGAGKVVGIMPVHLYGQACAMDEIMEIADKYNCFVVEDAAQAFGGTWREKKLGSIGTIGAFSFFPSKNLGACGDAGMIATNNEELSDIVRELLKHGGKDKYNANYLGYNARLDTLQAAILLAKLKYIDDFNEKRRVVAKQYHEGLRDVSEISVPIEHRDAFHVYHQYTIRVMIGKRDELRTRLDQVGISTAVYYPVPLHRMRIFANGRSKCSGTLEQSDRLSDQVLSLPIGPLQTDEETNYVINCVRNSI